MKSFYPQSIKGALRYLEFNGSGVPLIFLHGLGCASSFEYSGIATTEPLAEKPKMEFGRRYGEIRM